MAIGNRNLKSEAFAMRIADHWVGPGLAAAIALLVIAAARVAGAENPPPPARGGAMSPSGLRVPTSPLLDSDAPGLPIATPPASSEQIAAQAQENPLAEAYRSVENTCPAGPCCCTPNRWRDSIKPWLQETHWGYPELFTEAPAGSSVRAHANRQILGGLAGQMVLYRYDFHDEVLPHGAMLNDHGHRRLENMAVMLQNGLYPLVIEPAVNNPQLDARRRQNVLDALKNPTFEVPESWVILARPAGTGLSGVEAAEVYKNLLEHTRSASEKESMEGTGTTGAMMPVMAAPTQGRGGGY